ncbi:MAG: ATP-binding protein [Bacteroidales bacterium]|nr:ATP-binding protein [Bacteroidales bacterium]
MTLDGDDITIQDLLNRPNTQQIKQIIGGKKIVFIDEAQRIPNIGLTSKILIDKFKDVQLIMSGSSSFDLFSKVNEPLTGRKWTFNIWPVSWREWCKAKNKVYFYDNGIRNAVIGQLQPLAIRQDVGILWENFMVSERVKQISLNKDLRNYYFWRTTQQQEIDYVEEVNGKFFAYEFKWNKKRNQ